MKKLFLILLITGLFSCQNEKKHTQQTENKQDVIHKTQMWTMDADHSLIQWTAYKTTAKVPVKGEFKQFDITGVEPAVDMPSTLKHAQVDINIYSVFTSKEERDKKIIKYLFEKMGKAGKIHVKVKKVTDNQILADITMNNRTKEVPFDMDVDQKRGIVNLKGKIDLVKDFGAEKPLKLLNKACYKLHMGEDGISKTWSEVDLNAFFKYHQK